MTELKTQKNRASVSAFLNSIADSHQRSDAKAVLQIMKRISRDKPAMWGSSIVGFGSYHYRSKSGREGDWFVVGFSPRKQALVLYLMGGLESQKELLKKLGKHKTGKGCLYLKRLSDVDLRILESLIRHSVKIVSARSC